MVAYEAERHVVETFERIDEAVLRDPEVDFVCLDDGSLDSGADRLAAWAEERELDNLTVLHNPVNQGYGGNQKLGYRLAIDGGYEFVILLHGDGQYAPELLGALHRHLAARAPGRRPGLAHRRARAARGGAACPSTSSSATGS